MVTVYDTCFNSDVQCYVRLDQYCLQYVCVLCAVGTLGTGGVREQLSVWGEFTVWRAAMGRNCDDKRAATDVQFEINRNYSQSVPRSKHTPSLLYKPVS